MSHMAGALRRLRLESGLSLRDLARRLGVSSAYLSRVEHGLDPVPTAERLAALARELGLPPEWLLEIGHRLTPGLDRYLDHQPQAAALFAAIARRQLGAEELADIHRYVEARFPEKGAAAITEVHRLTGALSPERVVLGVRCGELDDAYEIACTRVATPDDPPAAADLAALVRARIAQVDPHLGGGVAVVSLALPRARPTAGLVGLAQPVESSALDGLPVSVAVLLVGPARNREMMLRIAQVSRLATRGLVDAIGGARQAHDAVQRIAVLERVG